MKNTEIGRIKKNIKWCRRWSWIFILRKQREKEKLLYEYVKVFENVRGRREEKEIIMIKYLKTCEAKRERGEKKSKYVKVFESVREIKKKKKSTEKRGWKERERNWYGEVIRKRS